MADDLAVAIERLRTSTQKLNTISDIAAQLVRDAEAFLEAARVGVPGQVLIPDFAQNTSEYDDDEEWSLKAPTESFLAYQRLPKSKKFRIVIVGVHPDCPDNPYVRAWSECSREEKLQSIQQLPGLLAEL